MAYQTLFLLALGLRLCTLWHTSQAFNLYPEVNPDKLAIALNISTECVTALNQSIPECDQTLFQMASNFDDYWWEDDNVTALCTSNCSQAASVWLDAISDPCYEEYVTAYGRAVPASSVAMRYTDGLNIICLASWPESDPAPTHPWCLTESQEWVGSDIVRVDCAANPSDPTCTGNISAIPDDYRRMANLYSDDLLCSDCFVWILWYRVTSLFLADSDHSDYLIEQLQDIQDVCSTQLPEVTIRNLPPYGSATVTLPPTSTASSPPAATTCAGQAVDSSDSSNGDCGSLSTKFGVSTGDLRASTASDTCQFANTICLPNPCTLLQVAANASGLAPSCADLAATFKATTVQFLSWNRNIEGLCDSLSEGQYVCGSAPGTNSSYALPPPPLGTDADAGNQQRGGPGGVVTPTSTVTTSANPVSGSGTAPSPTQDGLVSNCNNFATAVSGQGCFDFAQLHSIDPAQLYAWNPVLGLDGIDCTTALWASEYYCIGTRTAPTTPPGPTQTGIVSNCNKYAAAIKDDSCDVFAARNSISNAQLYAWNGVLGAHGENCGTSLWTDEYYCVGIAPTVSGPTTTTTTTSVMAPGPTQTGIVANCDKFAQATGGTGCFDFAAANGITTAQLYAWNTVLGPNGENCGTLFWADEYYCVGVKT
ncbi:carbohydrate-binding module family 50 protein [Xylaria grammica]|nr:carbohydrate-binding module family 50 protein [Xylaria grammica]